mgnify:CR=1 FL=1
MALVKTIGIRKDYRLGKAIVHALRGVNMQIDPGEFVAVWGPSGSGKTTLLNLIGAIDEPTEGEVFLNGRKLNALSDNERTEVRNRSIGFIFQNFNLIPVLSALENVMVPLQISGESYSRAKKTAGSRLEEVGLSRFIHHRPDKLSGGQSQRVAIARALIGTPLLVIADEPTANMDSETSEKIITLMREINQKGKTTFIFSTHDRRLLKHCNRLIEISDGRISEKGQS